MITMEEAFYQAKLILDCLPSDEYQLIPKNDIDFLKKNMKVDNSIVIDPFCSLEEQNIDDKTYDVLNMIVSKVDMNKIGNVSFENTQVDLNENSYKNKEKQVIELTVENEKLKEDNQKLYETISRLPKIVQKIFIKEDIHKMIG